MPFYDRLCTACGTTQIDSFEPVEPPRLLCADCGEPTERAWLTKPSNVIPDSMDWTQVNGCKRPIRFRSKSERRRYLKGAGWRETGGGESAGSTVTQLTLDNAKAMLERSAKASSGWRDPDKAPLGITSTEGLLRYMTDKRLAENRGEFGFRDR